MSQHDRAFARIDHFARAPLIGLLLAVASCATPSPADAPELATALESLDRRVDPAALHRALDRLDLDESTLTLPSPASSRDPASGAYWLVHALAWAPEVRASSRRARAAIAETDGAGAPLPLSIEVSNDEFGGESDRVEATLVLDLLGLLGVGQSRAERRRIDAEAALAVAELEAAIWRTWIEVESARIRLIAATARERRLNSLVEQARADLIRVELLFEAGWIGEAPVGTARAAVAVAESMQSVMREGVVASRAAFVQLVGAHEHDTALDALVQEATASLESVFAPDESFDADLLGEHPELRALRVEFLLRESEVRSVAASAWPGIGIGPRLGYEDQLAIGGVLRLDLPFPSSWRGRLAAAVERRDAVIEVYEDRVLALLALARSARARHEEIAARRSDTTARVVDGSTVGWQGARATFRVGRLGVIEWVDALNRRREAVTADIVDAEAAALAVIELTASRGPVATRFIWADEASQEVQP